MRLEFIEVSGSSTAGSFAGRLTFDPGLQIITGDNGYGKSLAATSVAWCLGLEPMFGAQDNDPSRFPAAAREELKLDGETATVLKSEASIRVVRDDGATLTLTRPIKGGNPSIVEVRQSSSDGASSVIRLNARREAMEDERGGLQSFLFGWLQWPRLKVVTFKEIAWLYLENIAPLFFIDQNEGWPAPQALQIRRYGQQQIGDIALDFALGDVEAINRRFAALTTERDTRQLKEAAAALSQKVDAFFLRNGWTVDWTAGGSLAEIVVRWERIKLHEALKRDAAVDLHEERKLYADTAEEVLNRLLENDGDEFRNAPAGASQRVIELKQALHSLNAALADTRIQRLDAEDLLGSLKHRIQAATDVLRLKTTGVGHLEHIECPTCHQEIAPELFRLRVQSIESIRQHIEVLDRDRLLVRQNVKACTEAQIRLEAEASRVDRELAQAQKDLLLIGRSVVGREQVLATSAELRRVEAKLDQLDSRLESLRELQHETDSWIAKTRAVLVLPAEQRDQRRRRAFVEELRAYLLDLGHTGVDGVSVETLNLQDAVPYLGSRRLSSTGSASDQPRLVAAYTLALASAAKQLGGFHPGFVLLDEPLQQNPDDKHRSLFVKFLTTQLAQSVRFQTVIFTHLFKPEVARLVAAGVPIKVLDGRFLLQLV